MSRLVPLLLALSLPVSTPALAEPDVAASDEAETDPEETVTGKTPPPLEREPRSPVLQGELPKTKSFDEYRDLPYPHEAYLGAQQMNLEPEFVHGIQSGLQLLYLRQYKKAREHFTELEQRFPGTGISAVVDTLVWQALMLENFDFRYDSQYWTSSKQAKAELTAALDQPGNEGWENLMMAAMLGIESIHTIRNSQYLNALQLAFSAMDHIEKARAAMPEFVDIALADGLYNYWRSVITMNNKMLPDFGDNRVEGLEQMQAVEATGVFLGPLATLSLAFSWMEEGDYRKAARSVGRNRQAFPDNIVNNLVAAQVYINQRKHDTALEALDHVLKVDPKNKRALYWKGVALLKAGRLDEAETQLQAYLASDHLETYQKSYAHYRLGQVYARQKQYAKAEEAYKVAVKIDGHKGARSAMGRLKDRKKAGKIDY